MLVFSLTVFHFLLSFDDFSECYNTVKNNITTLTRSMPGATMPNNSKKRIDSTTEGEREGRVADDILVVSAISLNWTFAAYKMQFTACWNFPRFDNGHAASVYNHKVVRRDTDAGGWKHQWAL